MEARVGREDGEEREGFKRGEGEAMECPVCTSMSQARVNRVQNNLGLVPKKGREVAKGLHAKKK